MKLSVVAVSTSMRDGRSARAHTTPESTETSPDWMPCVMTGRSATRLIEGLAMPPATVIAAVEAAVVRKRRRVKARSAKVVAGFASERASLEGERAWKARSRAASDGDGHWASAVESMRRTMAVVSDRDSTLSTTAL